MNINKIEGENDASGVCTLSIDGDMTIYTAEAVHQQLNDYLKEFTTFHFNMDGVEEIDSTGLQMLLVMNRCAKLKGGSVILNNISEAVKELFELFNVTDRFEMNAA